MLIVLDEEFTDPGGVQMSGQLPILIIQLNNLIRGDILALYDVDDVLDDGVCKHAESRDQDDVRTHFPCRQLSVHAHARICVHPRACYLRWESFRAQL